MKQIKLIVLALITASALFGATAPSSQGSVVKQCLKVVEPGTGNRLDPGCKEIGKPGEYIEVFETEQPQRGQGIFCALTVAPGAGNWDDSQCSKKTGLNEYILVYQPPHWHVNGMQVKQGAYQIKLQLKGPAVLRSKVVSMAVVIECKDSGSEGATIEGQGIYQGQDKGRLVFTQCKATVAGSEKVCKVEEPIKTNQTKSRLVTRTGTQLKYAELFEPTEGSTYAEIKLVNNGTEKCAAAGTFPVKGSVAAEISPGGSEGKEGLLNFPETPITEVLAGGEKVTLGLFLGANEAKFSAAYGATLASGEIFGVFGN